MTERERCPVCDFPLATEADSVAAREAGKSLMEVVVDRAGLCWSMHGYHRGPDIDWRARALKAEAALAALTETPLEVALKEEAERG